MYKKVFSDSYRLEQLLTDIDLDQDGEINYQEFFTVCADRRKIEIKSFLEDAFSFFDNDHDGQISLEELKNSFPGKKEVEDDVWKEMLNEVDENADDKISFDEFEKMLFRFLEEKPKI